MALLRRAERTQDEHVETLDGELLYARRLAMREGCLRCHVVSAETALAAIKAKFPGSPGWREAREGGFAGIVSVAVPLRAVADGGYLARVAGTLSVFLTAWCAAFGLVLWWLQRQVIHAALAMESYATALLAAKMVVRNSRVVVDADAMSSRNELHRASMSLKAVHRALRAAYANAAKTAPP
jgi:hypothetical protein